MIFLFRGGEGGVLGPAKEIRPRQFLGDVIAGQGFPSPSTSLFSLPRSVKQHFGKTSWAYHFQNPIWADFPWNPSISVGGIPFFLHFFSCSLWSGWWVPFNQQNGILPFLHCGRVEITSCAMVNMKMPCFCALARAKPRPPCRCQLFHPALPTLCLNPPLLWPQRVWMVDDEISRRRQALVTGTRPLWMPPTACLSCTTTWTASIQGNSGSAQLVRPLTSFQAALHRCRGPFQTADQSYDALLALISQEVPRRLFPGPFPGPPEASSWPDGHTPAWLRRPRP